MTSHLDSLSLAHLHIKRDSPFVPDLKHITQNKNLDDQEIERIRDMINYSQLHNTTITSNFDARLGVLAPPFGYISIVHSSTPFDCNLFDRNLFRGVAIIEIKGNWNRHVITGLKHSINALIPDKSPLPPSRKEPQRWICSLGANAWIGLYETLSITRQKRYAVVVSGLDDVAFEAMQAEMRDMHRVDSMRVAMNKLQFWKDIAKENRRRLLGVVCGLLSEQTQMDDVMFQARPGDTEPSKTERAIRWVGEKTRIPSWYCIPSRTPRDCAPLEPDLSGYHLGFAVGDRADKRHVVVDVMMDTYLDDISFYREELLIRFSGAMRIENQYIMYLNGPTQSISLITRSKNDIAAPETYNTVPVESSPRMQVTMPSFSEIITVTWEDNQPNRIAQSFYEPIPHSPLFESEQKDSLEAVFVRISMKDHLGRVSTEINDKKRMAGFCADPYEYITR